MGHRGCIANRKMQKCSACSGCSEYLLEGIQTTNLPFFIECLAWEIPMFVQEAWLQSNNSMPFTISSGTGLIRQPARASTTCEGLEKHAEPQRRPSLYILMLCMPITQPMSYLLGCFRICCAMFFTITWTDLLRKEHVHALCCILLYKLQSFAMQIQMRTRSRTRKN